MRCYYTPIIFDFTAKCVATWHSRCHVIMHRNSAVFYCKNYKDKSARNMIYDMSRGINNPEFYFYCVRAGWISLFLSFSLACCSFWPREMEIILLVRLLPNVCVGGRGVRSNQRASAVQLTEISIVIRRGRCVGSIKWKRSAKRGFVLGLNYADPKK